MQIYRTIFAVAALCAAGIISSSAQTPPPVFPPGGGAVQTSPAPASSAPVASAPVYVPDTSRQNDPLPDGVLAFDATLKTDDMTEGDDFARFTFSFTNITEDIVTILNVHPSCGCTTAELPPVPWQLTPGTNGSIKLSVNLSGKQGTLIKTVDVTTDKGKKQLMLRINLKPPAVITMTDEQKAAGIAAAKVDRQAVFKGDCATCHIKNVEGKNGPDLYKLTCAICHEAVNRATMVPDLAKLTVPTNDEFWRTWITYGKPGSLMPAFAQSQGGPLDDVQVAALAQYLGALHPSAVPAKQ
ncbi:MAG TPA: DUF1573 domain-containing protein [Verrucomicrobiae bacterium]|nr:DUF1573 domain-containing protein [Verrucomicrobiae bacterium]